MKPYFDDNVFPGELAHYGVKGMKWGVRKDRTSNHPQLKAKTEDISVKLKNGDTLSLSGKPTSLMTKFMARVNPGRIEVYNGRELFKIRDKNNSLIGEMQLKMDSPTTLNVAWVGINNRHRGNGYATAAMRAAIDHAKKKIWKP